jgi:ABC-type branched-subunit amino acid transport system substrate-binding protein
LNGADIFLNKNLIGGFRMKKNHRISFIIFAIAVFAALALLLGMPSTSFTAPGGKPIVIGYVGAVASPGTKPCMDIQTMAVEEINAAGGIMGRPVKYIVMDGKGDTSLSVEAARKLIIEDKATFISVEGRTEICLAVQENSGRLYKEYPHILVFNGPMGSELTARILDEPGKYDFCFRDWDPEPAHYAQMKYYFTKIAKELKQKRVAILWEDLAWTNEWRRGIDYIKLPTWEKLIADCGLELVYSKACKPRGTLYFPIFQEMADKKPDVIYYISSWFTDTESFAKQWADSAAKDIQISLYGGVAQTQKYWDMTGGKALGAITSYTDLDNTPVTPKTIPLMKKARARNIPMQIHVHIAYADIYHFKAAIEKAKGTNNIKALIKGMEDVTTVYSLGLTKYETQKIKPFYHSRMRVNPKDPWKTYPGYYYQLIGQYQKGGKFVFLYESCEENEKAMAKFTNLKLYKTPAELRK